MKCTFILFVLNLFIFSFSNNKDLDKIIKKFDKIKQKFRYLEQQEQILTHDEDITSDTLDNGETLHSLNHNFSIPFEIPDIKEKAEIKFLGFANFRRLKEKICWQIYFRSFYGKIGKIVTFTINIIFHRNRVLHEEILEKEAICILSSGYQTNFSIVQYDCSVNIDESKNFTSIQANKDFKFDGEKPNYLEVSLSHNFSNIQEQVNDNFRYFQIPLYKFKNSKLNLDNTKKIFKISGDLIYDENINNKLPKITEEKFELSVYDEIKEENQKVECNMLQNNNEFVLNCRPEFPIITHIKHEILFGKNRNIEIALSNITDDLVFLADSESIRYKNKQYRNNSSPISGGLFIGIAIIFICALLLIIIILRKKLDTIDFESFIMGLKTTEE